MIGSEVRILELVGGEERLGELPTHPLQAFWVLVLEELRHIILFLRKFGGVPLVFPPTLTHTPPQVGYPLTTHLVPHSYSQVIPYSPIGILPLINIIL